MKYSVSCNLRTSVVIMIANHFAPYENVKGCALTLKNASPSNLDGRRDFKSFPRIEYMMKSAQTCAQDEKAHPQ